MPKIPFPEVDVFFPSCFYSAVESYLKFMGKFQCVKKVYPWHTFRYIPPADGMIGFAPNGTDLNMLLESDYDYREIESNLEKYYGVRYHSQPYTSYSEFTQSLVRSIDDGKPVIIQFSMGYIKERRQYRQVFGRHIVTITGYDPAEGSFIAMEQGMGVIRIAPVDMKDCFDYQIRNFSDVRSFFITPDSSFAERKLDPDDLRAIIARNLENLVSQVPNLGLKGLGLFKTQLQEFLSSKSTVPMFAIPGLWQYSHERKALISWLQEVRKDLGLPEDAFFRSFTAHLEQCFQQWITIDYLIEKCIIGKNSKQLAEIPSLLESVMALEAKSVSFWSRLREMVPSA